MPAERPDWANDKLGRRWWDFHCAHPEVYDTLERLLWRLVRKGYHHMGIAMLWETLRYETLLGAGPGEDVVRLNNNHRALYARYLMESDPELAGIFEVRRRQGPVVVKRLPPTL